MPLDDRSSRLSPVLIFGGGGMLGQSLAVEGRRRGLAVHLLGRDDGDVTDADVVARQVRDARPGLIVNCAAFTDVDGCESHQEEAFEVNGRAVAHLVVAARRYELPLVQVSTDYVFDGRARSPYTEESETAPASVYGRSKLAGEREALGYAGALVLRTSWLFGPGGRNFVSTICRVARREGSLRVVDDQVGCPTYTPFLAGAILDLADAGTTGVVHYRNRGAVSWYQFAAAVLEVWQIDAALEPVATTEFPRPAPRPGYSVLDVRRFESVVGREVESWRSGLEDYHRHEGGSRADAESGSVV